MTATSDGTTKVLRAWARNAPGYDKQIAFLERIWLSGSRLLLMTRYLAVAAVVPFRPGPWRMS
jgi:hypothetical protein